MELNQAAEILQYSILLVILKLILSFDEDQGVINWNAPPLGLSVTQLKSNLL